MKKNLLYFISFCLSLEVASAFVVHLFLNENIKQWQEFDLYQQRNLMTWFDKKNNYHPYLTYISKDMEENLKNIEKQKGESLKIGIIGGSFAHYFSGFLKKEEGQKLVDDFRKSLGTTKDIEFIGLASGGYRQPQQMLTSVLFADKVDLFISVEGFNDLLPTYHACFPKDWNSQFVRYHPEFKGGWYRVGQMIKGLYQSLAVLSDYTHSMRLFFYFIEDNVLRSIAHIEQKTLNSLSNCEGEFKIDALANTEQWIKDVTKHHNLMKGLSKKLITVLQPNQYDPGMKTWSKEEEKLFQPFLWRKEYVEKVYPMAKERFNKLGESNNFLFLDMTDAYLDNKETLYSDGCCHVNKTGQKIFAQKLFDQLKELNIIN